VGSSYVEHGAAGFWAYDAYVLHLMRLLAEEVDRLTAPEPWLLEAREHWQGQLQAGGTGWFSPELNRFATSSERTATLLQFARPIQEGVESGSTSLDPIGPIPKDWFLQVVEAFALLLRGEWPREVVSCSVLPRIPERPVWSDARPELATISRCWARLEDVQVQPRPGESTLNRLLLDPWDSKDAQIQAAWAALTQPVHLSGLETWYRPDRMNPIAMAWTEAALRACRARQG
jgi:hypothetical protein